MDLILSSKKADKTIVEVEGVGGYYTWSSTQFPVLSQKKIAAGLLVLQHRGFALPHYSDSSKIAYVCEGECIAGLTSPEDSKEEVVKIQKGDTVPVTVGTVSWWYNAGDSTKLTIIFLGESSEDYTPGEYCYFFLTSAADSSIHLSYITKGSGRVVIVGLFGKVVLDTKVEEGEVFFVPKFFPFVVEADEGGIEFFSLKTSSKQTYGELSSGKKSIWEAASPSILEASLNMTPDLTKSFKSKIAKGAVIAPPSTI
ncbi:hypothetical protein MTR67_005826 [Solanum verrucosum]|uniref:Cupin type-1 domain-containing protein n=1 Tax=Solanum verrucosum TaxID=315347 RepID=A0AAF0TBE6_SOLVR|nr:hypothetical protein MTR67_005826 [Solanum verrucosum]